MTHIKPKHLIRICLTLLLMGFLHRISDAQDPEFTPYVNGTIRQESTGLLWQNSGDGKGRNWCEARQYCDQLELGECTDWRLPTKDELISLTEENAQVEQSTGNGAVTSVFHHHYWSDTFEIRDRYHSGAFSIHGTNADTTLSLITKQDQVRCVCGDQPIDSYVFTVASFTPDSFSGMTPFAPQIRASVLDSCSIPLGEPPYTFELDYGDGSAETVVSESGESVTRHPYYVTGGYTLKVTATDANGKQAESAFQIQVFSDETPPSVAINLPREGSVLKEMAQIICEVKDERQVKEVKLYVDGKAYGKMIETNLFVWEARFNSYSFKNGSHELTIKAFNDQGLLGSATITVTTDN